MDVINKILNYSHYKNVKYQEDQILQIAKKNNTESIHAAFIGVAFEYLLMDIKRDFERVMSNIPLSSFNLNLIKKLEEDPQFFVVFLVVFNHIKENDQYKDNFFFKIFKENLKNQEISIPEDHNLQIPKFLRAYREIFGTTFKVQFSEIN